MINVNKEGFYLNDSVLVSIISRKDFSFILVLLSCGRMCEILIIYPRIFFSNCAEKPTCGHVPHYSESVYHILNIIKSYQNLIEIKQVMITF